MRNLSGQKFGKLTIIKFSHKVGNNYYWICRCDCGNEKIAQAANLRSGSAKNCGCENKYGNTKHGLTRTTLYNAYSGMMQRCYYKKVLGWKNWGGRGITVCDEWRENRMAFFEWAKNNGYEKGLQLDRIDNNGNYSPDNCRFVTRKVNVRNKRGIVIVKYLNESKPLSEWCEILNLKYQLVKDRIQSRKWPAEIAFTLPVLTHSQCPTFRKEAIKEGKTVPGAELVTRKNLMIK